ncbi:AMP-binding protein [Bradyrhizobium sp. NP1]|uniref:AMP-binding protein n=1 Tax=Bradyrhizobium sp. NP1 TaxID=3049772 RepID=UPI0025A4D355|nr:AMP-binding protein [Bradyrhizobium sp. NP1]WJR80393.1 AMP-binding protein [Bradyrhizobium sp. NP1]
MLQAATSYAHGACDEPLIGETIGARFDLAVALWSSREALVVPYQNVRWTYRELSDKVNAFAAGLLALGLRPGDRIGIWSPNNAEWVVAQFAAAKAGLILVTINPAYRVEEAGYALDKVGCKALVIATSHKGSNYAGMLNELAPELAGSEPGRLKASRLPKLEIIVQIGEAMPGALAFDNVIELGVATGERELHDIAAAFGFDDATNIQFTSGTTGPPKGATLTHHNVLNNAYFSGRPLKLSCTDRICLPVPLYHCFGMVLGNLMAVLYGATLVYPDASFDPLRVLQAVEAERCTVLYGVPTMFIGEMEHPQFSRFDLRSLRTGIMAGSPCPLEVMRRVIERMNLRELTIGYGMTETSPLSCQGSPDDPIERRVGTVGRAHPHVEIKIVDRQGTTVPRGSIGELLVRGYSVMQCYWGDPEKTAETIDTAGWLHTGDLATMDAEGYCNIVGRLKDMIIRGGENIYPREIEETLHGHPGIEAACAFGVPDAKFGEQICVWVRLRSGWELTANDVRDYCRARLAHFKAPHYVKFVEEFPMTVTGKVRKVEMRAMMREELGLREEQTA